MSDEKASSPGGPQIPHPNSQFPPAGRLLGLDFGTKRVGVAVSDVEQRFAAPLGMFARSSARG
ncbi:MAG TPA: RuvX/YqgF family protein, partial [Planctomycetaceae bacterium]